MKKTIFIFLALCSVSLCLQAQDVKASTITWTSDRLFNINTGEMQEDSNVVISTNATSVEWKKTNGTSVVFNVSEVIGQWANVNGNGEIIYEISNSIYRGNITFSKNSSGTMIRMILVEGESGPVMFELPIINYQAQ